MDQNRIGVRGQIQIGGYTHFKRSNGLSIKKAQERKYEGSLHPLPEGRGIREPPHSGCNNIKPIKNIKKKSFISFTM